MKIPKNAELKFKGKIFDVYQWQQEMFDGTFETFEMLKRSDTVIVIPIVDGKFLINEEEQPRKPKFYTFPCGRIDNNEKTEEAVKRELLEETGYEAENLELLMNFDPEHKIEWTVHVFIAKNCKKIAEQKLDAGEKITTKLVDFDELVKIMKEGNYWGSELTMYMLNNKEKFKEILK